VHGPYVSPTPLELLLQDVSLDVVSSRRSRLFGAPRCLDVQRCPPLSRPCPGAGCDRGPKTVRLLNDINAHFKSGELVALMSPSGAGKSTLLNILAERTRPDATLHGTVSANGLRLSEDYRHLCAFLPQGAVLWMTTSPPSA
jgi:ABC-type multidrug transport system fused ATPase/permease subunit